jgi:hypothetical protein
MQWSMNWPGGFCFDFVTGVDAFLLADIWGP